MVAGELQKLLEDNDIEFHTHGVLIEFKKNGEVSQAHVLDSSDVIVALLTRMRWI